MSAKASGQTSSQGPNQTEQTEEGRPRTTAAEVLSHDATIIVLQYADEPKTVEALSAETGMAEWVCEDRVQELLAVGLLERHSGGDGGEAMFERSVEEVTFSFSGTDVTSDTQTGSPETAAERLANIWEAL
jgi:hypothetical protein